jgi:hypothetical protein
MTAAITMLALLGCGEATLETGAGGIVESGAVHDEELMYLRNADEVGVRFASGDAQFEPSRTFRSVELMATIEGAAPLDWRARTLDGAWSDWAAVPFGEPGQFRHAVIGLDGPANALMLREPGGLVFARLAFQSSQNPESDLGHEDDPVGLESPWDDTADPEDLQVKRAQAGRWQPANGGGSVYVPYTRAPSWSGGRNCSGRMTDGAQAVGTYAVEHFAGARYFQGYNCRQIRGSSGMSMHGTGRAVDIFVPLSGGQADNDLGDPLARWLIENADEIGVQMVIWDRTIWMGNRAAGSKARYYSGAHPHHDHLHIELTPDAAAGRTAFFGGRVAPPSGGGAAPVTCDSATLGHAVPEGTCVQMSYDRCGGTCNWARCTGGSWGCTELDACDETHGNAQCQPARAPAPEPEPEPEPKADCYSRTLSASVADGVCVQMAYDACGGTCHWAVCDDGGWVCNADMDRCGAQREHAACAPAPAAPSGDACWSRTLGRNVHDGGFVQMAYDACGGTCHWAVCDDGDWACTAPDASGPNFSHAQCR